MSVKPKCLLGMSGGTDSSVAAILLQNQGYEVIGVTFRFQKNAVAESHILDAKQTAQQLHIQHFVCDACDAFQTQIIDYFISEYLKGRTPVPCTICNNQLKWPLLEKLAKDYGCEKIATGHYCNLVEIGDNVLISKGLDKDKDQSFFLWALPQRTLKKILFPLGNLSKPEVRNIAERYGLKKVAQKKDSLGICFCKDDYRDFLKEKATNFNFEEGFFVDEENHILGKHQGFPFYTVGQRRGLIHLNRKVFVKEIFPETNTIVLAPLSSLYKTSFLLTDSVFSPLIYDSNFSSKLMVKIRYRKQLTPCKILPLTDGTLRVSLLEPLESISPGQAAVFYADSLVLGGGIIL